MNPGGKSMVLYDAEVAFFIRDPDAISFSFSAFAKQLVENVLLFE